jgi:hypothetical protein
MLVAENAWGSLVRWVQDKITYFNAEGILEDAVYLEWDAHASINDLPSGDVLGLKSFAIMEDDNVLAISCAIGVGTFDETNLFRLRKSVAILFQALLKENSIDYYDMETGLVVNRMIIAGGTSITPVARADVRSIQFVQFECLLENQ